MKKVYLFIIMLLFSAAIWAQTIPVTGQIKNAMGEAVSFATVAVKGTNTAVSADQNGNFSINASAGAKLVVSATGFKPVEVPVENDRIIAITLTAESNLQEVVVTALGIKRNEKALGYSISKVNPDAIIQKSEPDMLKGMQGKVAGVDIRTSQGTPGAATRIQIRGNSSFFGDNQPLIIVDGIPFSNDQVTTADPTSGGSAYSSGISNLDPNDIATMNVLKGSAAAALYGSRASNGVILITTKSGSASRGRKGTEITYNSSYSFEKIANLPEFQNEYGAGSYDNYSAGSNGSWGAPFRSLDSVPLYDSYKNEYPELFPASGNIPYRAYPNNVKDLFETGHVIENSINVSSGNEKNSVSITASNLLHDGYVPNSSYNRSNLGFGGSAKLSNGLNVRGNFNYSRSNQSGGFFGENQTDYGSQFARTMFLARNWDFTNWPYEDKEGNNIVPNSGYDNPRWAFKYNRALTNEERIIAGVHADFNFNKWIKADYNLGTNINSLSRKEITEIGSSTLSAEGLGRLILDNYRKQEIESNLFVTLTPSLGNDDLSLRVVVGNNINQRNTTRQSATGKKFITRGIYTLSNTSQQTFGVDQELNGDYLNADIFESRRLIGMYGEVGLSFKDYAFLTVTGRNDWSSTLPLDSRSYFYPSVSGSFVFTDAFKITSNVLDYGKVRAGWAKVGRDADPYSLQNVYALGLNFLGQPTAAAGETSFDPNLKPEFTQEIEIGTQLSFFKRRIELDVAVYNRNSSNLLAPITVPESSGYAQYYTNFGKINNKGIEIDLNVVPVRSKSFSWSVRGIFTKNRNFVTELIEGVDRLPLLPVLTEISPYLEAGKPFGYLRGTKVYRDSASGSLLINPQTGGMMEQPEQGMIGDPNPDFKLGVTNTITYKNFSLSVLFDMTKGGDMYSVTTSSLLGRGVTKDTRDRETLWVIPGIYGDPDTGLPLLSGGKTIPNQTRIPTNDLYFSSGGTTSTFAINTGEEWNVYDATVYRLRELSLGYEFPKSLFEKLPIGSVSITFTGRNLWYLAPNFPKYTNFDPEVNSFGATSVQGIELSAAPTTRRLGANLRVTF